MRNLINQGDLFDLKVRIKQKKIFYFLNKLNLNSSKRVYSTWNLDSMQSSNWWQVPEVKKRCNFLQTGNSESDYIQFISKNLFSSDKKLKMLSIGCGNGNIEYKWAQTNQFYSILGIDLADKPIEIANNRSKSENLNSILIYKKQDFYTYQADKNSYDVILFHSSLHHIMNLSKNVERVIEWLKPGGKIIINEYVGPNRFQFSDERLNYLNQLFKEIPDSLKITAADGKMKKKLYAPGYLRMLVSDPSEAVESNAILNVLNSNLNCIYHKGYGGNLLQFLLKDIAHHFMSNDELIKGILYLLFNAEDEWIRVSGEVDDFVVAVFEKPT